MKTLNLYAVLAVIILSFLSVNAQSKPFQFQINFEKIPNLVYQLDCLNDFTNCQKDDFQMLWEKEFLKTSDDRKMLESWKEIRGRYQQEIEIPSDKKFPITKRQSSVNLEEKLMIAGLQAKNLDDYLSRLDLLILPRDRESFEKVIRHFEPSFSNWWENEVKEKGQNFAAKTSKLLNSSKINENITRFYNFYQPSLPENYLITFDLFYRPNLVKTGSSGRAFENHLLVEFLANENPAQRIDVVLHEFCHFLLANISDTDLFQFQTAFLKSEYKTAIPAFNLFDEAVATALGNGIIGRLFTEPEEWQKYLVTKNSFYNNPNIDKAAKEILPILDDQLKNNGKLTDPKFIELYINALEKAFGESLLSPQKFLGKSYLFIDEKFDLSLVRNFRQNMKPSSFFAEKDEISKRDFKEFFDNPNLSAVFIVFPQNAQQLVGKKIISPKDYKELSKAIKSDKRVLYAVKRNENAYNFIIIAENDETAKELTKDLAEIPKILLGKNAK